jgi:hypothetical protein
MKNPVIILLLSFIFCGSASIPPDWKKLNLVEFTISVPKQWNSNIPQDQEDSLVGQIFGPNVELSFDCSNRGYANHLLFTEQEYLKKGEWMHDCYFCKPGIAFSNGMPNIGAQKYIHTPTAQQKIKFPKADYVADLSYKDSTVYLPIEIPQEIKQNNIQLDSDSKYVYKTIWAKVPGKGITGIYIHSRKSYFNFQMNGKNLSANDQESALKAFKTIRFTTE